MAMSLGCFSLAHKHKMKYTDRRSKMLIVSGFFSEKFSKIGARLTSTLLRLHMLNMVMPVRP